MNEQSVDNNKVSDYKGLEILITYYLKALESKSDFIILFSHYILTQGLNYDCVVRISDPYLDEKDEYKILDMLPSDWNQLPGEYSLTYKKDETIKIVSGLKQNKSFVLYVQKKNGDRDNISGPITLNHYIPDEFFIPNHAQYNNIRSLQVRDIMNIITRTISGNKKFKFEDKLDSAMDKTNIQLLELLLNKDEEILPNLLNESDENSFGPQLVINRGKPKETEKKKGVNGEHCLQDLNKHKPEDVNRVDDFKVYHHPVVYMQEDLDGEPTSSIYT